MPDIEVTIVEATPINVEITKTGPPGGGGGGGAVDSVFGRAGVVVAQDNDYDDTQIAVDDTDIRAVTDNVVTGTNVHEIIISLLTNFGTTIISIFNAVATKFDKVTDTLDDIIAGTTNKHFTATEKTKLSGIEAGAEVNNISDANATDLTDGNDSTLHYHLSDRDVKPRLTGGIAYRQTQLDNWFNALAAATAANPVDVVFIGDSINALGTASIPNPPGYFEKYINQSLGVAETTDVPIGVYGQADYSPTATSTQGSVTATSLGGFGSALSNTQVLTHVATCVGFSVAYRTFPGAGTLTIRDGAGGTVLATINCDAAAKSGNLWHSGALSNGSHTLHITSSGNTVVEIIHPNYGHKVRVWNCAHAGYKSADYTANSYLALDLIDTLETAGSLKLVVIATGANDNGGSGYATDIPALIAAVEAHSSCDLALWFPYISGALPLAEYTPARVAAYATGLPVIDSSVVAANSQGIDGVHPDTWQKRMLGLQQAAFLGGDPMGILIRQLHDPSRAGIIIPSLGGSGPEISNISGLLASFFGAPGPGFTIGDGTTTFGDTTIARKSAKRLSINNGEGTIEGNLSPALNAQTGTTYTLVLADAGKHITRSNASASTQTLPQNSDAAIPIGTIINITNLGAGLVTFVAGTGATITGLPSISQYQSAQMVKHSTNGWNIVLSPTADPLPKSGGVVTGQTTFRVGTTGEIKIGNPGGEELLTLYKAVGDANSILTIGQLFTNPLIGFGPGGASALDTTLLRLSAGRLAINNAAGGGGTLRANLSPDLNAQTGTTYTLVLDDAGKTITRSNTAASTQTFPQNSDAAIPIGTIINIINLGTGLVSFAAGSGATITGTLSIRQYQRAMAVKTATNSWNIAAPEIGKTATIAPTSGDYYSMGGQSGAGTPGLTASGKLILHPLWLDAGTLDRIAVSTSVAAVSTYRLGLYKANPVTGLPDGQTPFLDAGTVDMNATAGVQAITINKEITEPGLYWAAVLVEAYTAQPTTHNVVYSSSSGSGILGLPQDMSSLGRFRVARTYGSTVSTGSLPTVPTSSMSWAGTAPRVAVRYA